MATPFLRPVAQRAVHLHITPRPSSIGESREILRLLGAQFGAVEHYRNLRYDALSAPDAALVIFATAQAADECVRSAPVRFRMGRTKASQPQDQQQEDEHQLFQIQAHPAYANFRNRIDAGAYHGRFALRTARAAQHDLAQRVPVAGLSCVDWRAPERPWRVMRREREEEGARGRRTLRQIADGVGREVGRETSI